MPKIVLNRLQGTMFCLLLLLLMRCGCVKESMTMAATIVMKRQSDFVFPTDIRSRPLTGIDARDPNNNNFFTDTSLFMPKTTQSPRYFQCMANCPTTSEYNPICGSNQQLYPNEQKFRCARQCGADVQLLRRGNCMGLFSEILG